MLEHNLNITNTETAERFDIRVTHIFALTCVLASNLISVSVFRLSRDENYGIRMQNAVVRGEEARGPLRTPIITYDPNLRCQ